MIKIENTEVFGWEAAIRGMRNPMNSWDKSDSYWVEERPLGRIIVNNGDVWDNCQPLRFNRFNIGENDLKLMKSLSKAGNDHGKFLRMINVTFDCTAPIYWWKEADTYRCGKEQNSCSTMHKIHAKEFTLDDFSHEHLDKEELDILEAVIYSLNWNRKKFLETKDKKYWWHMIQMLPSSYNQKRTVQLNYQVLKSMYFARKDHKLDEWHTLCEWMEGLPYFREVVIQE
jgi:hypothetical protein